MKSRFLIAVVAILGYAIIDGQSAHAVKYFTDRGSDSNWDTDGSPSNWSAISCSGTDNVVQPAATDAAVICQDKVVDITDDNNVALKVTLESPSDHPTTKTRIKIDPAGADATLTLGGGSVALTSTLNTDAKIRLMDDFGGPNEARLSFITQDHTVTGEGDIVGEDNLAEILIASVTLTLGSTGQIIGHLKIMDGASAGTFLNNGQVIANAANGTLDMQAGTIDDSFGSGRWQVTSLSSARLLFSISPAALEGDFCVSNGTLEAGIGSDTVAVDSQGSLSHGPAGEIVVGMNDSFHFNAPAPP